jgi:transcription antitermination factor NusG
MIIGRRRCEGELISGGAVMEGADNMDARVHRWFACCTRPRHEHAVTRRFQSAFIEAYLPLIPRLRRWSDRSKIVLWPAFQQYVFARVPRTELWRLHATTGVRYVVSHGPRPAVVPEAEIENVRRVIVAIANSGAAPAEEAIGDEETMQWATGDVVRVVDGPFKGVDGIVRQRRGRWRLLVTVGSIGRGIAVDIDARMVRRANRSA